MKSVVMTGPGRVEIREVHIPRRKPGETLLRLLFGGICGKQSMNKTYKHIGIPIITLRINFPQYLGHKLKAYCVNIVIKCS